MPSRLQQTLYNLENQRCVFEKEKPGIWYIEIFSKKIMLFKKNNVDN